MKTIILKMMMIVAIVMSFSTAADAQIYVKIRPHNPIVKVRPPAPSPAHVWISGEWTWGNGQYNYREGYWDRPSRNRHGWVEGHWRHTRRGWVWMPGHWR